MKVVALLLALLVTAPAAVEAQVFRGDTLGKPRPVAAKSTKPRPAPRRAAKAPAKRPAKVVRAPARAAKPAPDPSDVIVIIEDP